MGKKIKIKKRWPEMFISTYHGSLEILKVTSYLFNKYWSDEQLVTVFSDVKPDFKLPKNFKLVVKKRGEGPEHWGSHLKECFEEYASGDVLFWMLDDEIPIDYLDPDIYDYLVSLIRKDKKIARIGVGFDPSHKPDYYRVIEEKCDYDVFELKQDAPYRVTTQGSLWRKDYLLKHLDGASSAWDFEVSQSEKSNGDGFKILGTRRSWAFQWNEHGSVSRKSPGKINILGSRFEDIREIVKRKLANKNKLQYGHDPAPMFKDVGFDFNIQMLKDKRDTFKFWEIREQYGRFYDDEKPPPYHIPKEHIDAFSMAGRIPMALRYIDGTYEEPIYYSKKLVQQNIDKVKVGGVSYYGDTDEWLYEALGEHEIEDDEVAIMGSVEPWYESVCLAYGGKPTTIEYNKIETDDKRIEVLTVEEFDKKPRQFDSAFSISSFEHDGLGRYGDPVDPFSDFKAMNKMKRIVKKGGLMFFAVPVGRDLLVWNAHRVYGGIRLPLMLAGWKVLSSYGFDNSLFAESGSITQPVFVLENI